MTAPRLEIEELGYSAVTAPGHGATFRLMPADSPVDEVAWGLEGMGGIFGGDEVQSYLKEIQAQAAERVGDSGPRRNQYFRNTEFARKLHGM